MTGGLVARATDRRIGMAIFAVAFTVRLLLVLRAGSLLSDYGYDPGVYYGAGDALVHGRLPYADFVLLHPPGIMLATTPFALLGRLTTDHLGYLAGNLAFMAVSGVNAALVTAVARRLGVARRAAVLGGLFYAVWLVPATSEYLIRLEPLGNLLLLSALWFAVRREGRRHRDDIAAGALLAAACSVKIWFGVPFLLVGVWLWRRGGHRAGARYLLGAAALALLVDGPFALLAGAKMWSMVVLAQLHRGRAVTSPLARLSDIASITRVWNDPASALRTIGLLVSVLILALVVRRAWRSPALRPIAGLAAAQVGVLLTCPSWFTFYADFAAVPIALLVAGAAQPVPGRVRAVGRTSAWLPLGAVAGLTAIALVSGSVPAVLPWRGTDRMIAAIAGDRCVTSDTPGGLIQLNVLDRDFARGCTVWVDVTGRTYLSPDRAAVTRSANARWQHDLVHYLRTGGATLIIRAGGDGLTTASARAIAGQRLRVDGDGDTVYLGKRRVP